MAKQEHENQESHEQVVTPDHLVPIYKKEWAAWKWICVRSAGFPYHLVERLAAHESVAAAAKLTQAQLAVKASVEHSAFEIRQTLSSRDQQRLSKRIQRSLKSLSQGRIPTNLNDLPATIVSELLAARRLEETAASKFKEEFQSDVTRISSAIRDMTNDDMFQRALLLQNAQALRRIWHAFRSAVGTKQKSGSKDRRNEELIASYLQRYCVKNDTVGFFGPAGWGRFVTEGPAMTGRVGPSLIQKSLIYFEHWCIEAVANKISENQRLRPWIAPRRSPYFHLEGCNLHYPDGTQKCVLPCHAAILERCDGERTAFQISHELMRLPQASFQNEAEVYSILHDLAERHLISWKLDLPVGPCAEQRLRDALDRIEPVALRLPAIAVFDELENARLKVAAASSDPRALDASLRALEETFTRVTGKQPSRRAGETYAGRTLIYNDCRRDLNLEIGPAFVGELGPPLSLLLASARWFSHRIAQLYRRAFLRAFWNLNARSKTSQVGALQFWIAVQPLIYDSKAALFNQVQLELQECWQKILNLKWHESRSAYKSSDLRAKVYSTFNSIRPGWRTAIYHSPDLMIAAPDVDSICSGNYQLVLGELHLAAHTLRDATWMLTHPAPHEMYAAMKNDVPAPHVFLIPRSSGLTTRTAVMLIPDNHLLVEISPESVSLAGRSRTLPISAFRVEASGEEVFVHSRDGSLSLTAIEFLSEALSEQMSDLKILQRRQHTPRVMIDRLIVHRESWCISASEFPFINEVEESLRFYHALRWRESLRLPRFVFARVSIECKPIYVDFESPVYVELLRKMIRRVLASDHPDKQVELSEMLPSPEQNWLRDAREQKYTSELRVIISDQIDSGSAVEAMELA